MKIWIHINGIQEGPFEPEQLPLNRMDPQTPVWYEGLDYWKPASAAPVTADILRAYYAGEISPDGSRRQPAAHPTTVDVEEVSHPATTVDVDPKPGSGAYAGDFGSLKYGAYGQYGARQGQYARQPEKCPPTYLVWSIILTLLCCNPLGIVSTVLGWSVLTKYKNYDIEGARRRSETTAWWFIITIVTSLVFTPMYMLVSL